METHVLDDKNFPLEHDVHYVLEDVHVKHELSHDKHYVPDMYLPFAHLILSILLILFKIYFFYVEH